MSTPRNDGFDDRPEDQRGWTEPTHLGQGGASRRTSRRGRRSGHGRAAPGAASGSSWEPPGWSLPDAAPDRPAQQPPAQQPPAQPPAQQPPAQQGDREPTQEWEATPPARAALGPAGPAAAPALGRPAAGGAAGAAGAARAVRPPSAHARRRSSRRSCPRAARPATSPPGVRPTAGPPPTAPPPRTPRWSSCAQRPGAAGEVRGAQQRAARPRRRRRPGRLRRVAPYGKGWVATHAITAAPVLGQCRVPAHPGPVLAARRRRAAAAAQR